MKTTLIFLSILAVILGVFAFFAVFGSSSGTYAINATSTGGSTTTFEMESSTATTTASSSLSLATSTGASAASTTDFYGTAFASPALGWPDGGATFSITAAALQGNQLSFTLSIQMGASPACVPLDIRLVADESGDLQGPNTPSFTFPDSGNCNGAPNETYENQVVTFTVNPANLPFLFTTGGSANIFFEVVTSTANGLQIDLPSTNG